MPIRTTPRHGRPASAESGRGVRGLKPAFTTLGWAGHNTPMSLASILGPGGAVAHQLDGYETRPQQLAMAEAVEEALAEKRHLMVEAGTGVGKSFAYLVPALLAATAEKNFRVVVSTHTISLQEQLLRK